MVTGDFVGCEPEESQSFTVSPYADNEFKRLDVLRQVFKLMETKVERASALAYLQERFSGPEEKAEEDD